MTRPLRLALGAVGLAVLTGCASLGIDDAVKQTNSSAAQFTGGNLELSRTKEQRDARLAIADELLNKPLTQDAAVRLALANSPALQAMVAQSWAEISNANQATRFSASRGCALEMSWKSGGFCRSVWSI